VVLDAHADRLLGNEGVRADGEGRTAFLCQAFERRVGTGLVEPNETRGRRWVGTRGIGRRIRIAVVLDLIDGEGVVDARKQLKRRFVGRKRRRGRDQVENDVGQLIGGDLD